ncbi:uncharacterized protein BcabD6B2_10310 [Babesia caballi]|uniref:Uncharacterized protein n=1 Tax=Babesia caballi TaxID=5871 RepID=A0AAV4LP26_BABCB|nr:hypothetical protein BcabD6B2_10310 [Babesia caballi]
MSRQKSGHKSTKAADVKAVGATGQGGESRVAGEAGGGWAGRLDVNVRSKIGSGGAVGFRELIKALEGLSGNFVTGHTSVKLSATEAIRSHKLIKGVAMTTATKALTRPLRLAIEEELGQSLVNFFDGGEETLDALPSLRTVVVSVIYVVKPF